MGDFGKLSNVRVAKDEQHAILLLRAIKEEMERRFVYMEKHGFNSIEPERDNLDKVVVGIDEASVLFAKGAGDKSGKMLAEIGRQLTDELAKLGRAAGIHLILATQKVVKETIDTKIQENIGGRICFRTNTLAGSMVVLGNKMAYELPDIKGRAIWSCGHDFVEVQTPYLSKNGLSNYLEEIKADYEMERKSLKSPMLEFERPKKAEKLDILNFQDGMNS
jgi:S-DNA-T family DNA segregation ATPase FtsK/SpoIIIE